MTYIVIVEDERSIVVSLQQAFEAAGHVVDCYCDPLVALPKVICVPPDVLILNGRMPGLHGIAFFCRFRAYSTRPVMFLSANAEEIEEELATMGLSAEAYVAKPFSQRYVVACAERLARLSRRP